MQQITRIKIFFCITVIISLEKITAERELQTSEDESVMKCDACRIISRRFADSFKKAEVEIGGRQLNEDEYIEAAESTCDEEWTGYGVDRIDGIQRLAGKFSDVSVTEETEFDQIWERRMQDFCDELLAESPDEKTLYNLWKSDSEALENYFCEGEGIFKACIQGEDFGIWPGDDYDDYDDVDFDYVHDEF